MTKSVKRNTVISALLAICLCISLIAGATFAIFTSSSSVNIAVTSGKVKLAATISGLEAYTPKLIAADGTVVDADNLADNNDETLKVFGNGGSAMYDKDNNELKLSKLTPGDKLNFKITVENLSTVNVKYRTRVLCDTDDGLFAGLKFNIGGMMIKSSTIWKNLAPADENGSAVQTYDCYVELPAAAGNEYQEKSCTITYIVEAVQGNAATTDDENVTVGAATATTVIDEDKVTTESGVKKTTAEITLASADSVAVSETETVSVVSAKVPEGVHLEDDAASLTIKVCETEKPSNFTVELAGNLTTKTLEVTMEGLKESNETPLTVELYVGAGLSGFNLYHHDVKMTAKDSVANVTADQEYYYNKTTGIVTMLTATFSPFTYTYAMDSWADNMAESYIVPVDDANKIVTVSSAEELALLASQVNAGTSYKGYTVKLVNDVDLGDHTWTPIGRSGNTFQGIFDGQGKTISNVRIHTGGSDVGLFGVTTDGEIKNFTLKNATVKGYLDVGAVAGTPYTSRYTNITLTGDVRVNGYAYVGGMFGKNAYANLTDLTIDVNKGSYVNAESEYYRTYVGGLVGFMGEGNIVVKNVTSNIDVIGSTCDVGGITGIAHYGNSFINCHSSGNVTLTSAQDEGDELEIGGIAGVWLNTAGQTVTLKGCLYTGKLSSTNVNTGAVTEFAYDGLVGNKYNRGSTDGTLIIN